MVLDLEPMHPRWDEGSKRFRKEERQMAKRKAKKKATKKKATKKKARRKAAKK